MTVDETFNQASLIGFIEQYKAFDEATTASLWNEFEGSYKRLIAGFYKSRIEALHAEEGVASSYNMFSILKLHFSEVRLHTPILANLIDPNGNHAQGLLFYKHFLSYCLAKKPLPHATDVDASDLYVKDEECTAWGNIDILIHNKNSKYPFAIVVENKIYAVDQYRQLYRYLSFAKRELGLKLEQIRVIYLSPSGKRPDFSGLNETEKVELEKVLVIIGYQTHIYPMLEKVLSEVKAPKVKHTIEQYMYTIKNYVR